MATRTWDDGAADGNFATAANWSADTAPVDGDTAIVAQSSRSIIAGVIDAAHDGLAALRILPGYGSTGAGLTIGDDANPLDVDATELEINNKACRFIKLNGAYPTVYARALGLCRLYFGSTSDVGDIYAGADGFIEIGTSCKCLSFTSAGCGALIKGDTSSPDDMVLYIPRGCTVEVQRRINKAIVHGTLIMTGAAEAVDGGAGAGSSELTIFGKLDARNTGNISKIRCMAGSVIDGTQQVGPPAGTKPTITTLIKSTGSSVSLPASLWTLPTPIIAGDETVT